MLGLSVKIKWQMICSRKEMAQQAPVGLVAMLVKACKGRQQEGVMHVGMGGWVNRCLDGWIDGWTDGWMHVWMDGWMYGWMGACTSVCVYECKHI